MFYLFFHSKQWFFFNNNFFRLILKFERCFQFFYNFSLTSSLIFDTKKSWRKCSKVWGLNQNRQSEKSSSLSRYAGPVTPQRNMQIDGWPLNYWGLRLSSLINEKYLFFNQIFQNSLKLSAGKWSRRLFGRNGNLFWLSWR